MVIQGVIKPPPEIRAVADRTASYVAKNGRAFEQRILSSAKGKTPKFAFLQPNNPFHAYYQERITFYENGGVDEKPEDAKKEKVAADQTTPDKAATNKPAVVQTSKVTQSAIDPVAKALLTQRNRIAALAAQNKSSDDSQTDHDNEENPNQATRITIPPPQPLHFINIVPPAALTIVQIETIQLVAQLTALDDKGGTFLQSLTRREWSNPQYAFCQPRHGHFAYFSALVDAYRHVIHTWTTAKEIGKDGVKEMANNPQHCLQMAAYRAEYNRHLAETRRQEDITPAVQIDWHDFVVVETIDFPKDEQVVTLPPPPPSVSVAPPKADDEMQDSDDEQEQIRVVPTYQPKVVAAGQSTMETVIDPITGQRVRVADMPEHMRIQLLDPKWAEERKKFQDKQKDSNLVGGDMVADNLARLAQARGMAHKDVLETESDAKKKLQDANRVLREQALDPKTKVGPILPASAAEAKRPPLQLPPTAQPEPKRPKITQVLPPSSGTGTTSGYSNFTANGPTVDPFAAAAAGAGATATGAFSATPPTQSEADFLASLPRPEVTLQVRVPNDPAQMAWNFYGQIVSLSVHAMSTVKAVKQELSRQHLNQMPVNKVQLKLVTTGAFLKDAMTLAALNIGPTATLELKPKTRSGRK